MQKLKEKQQTKNLYSFDIFDTIITRKTATPYGIFQLMQNILQKNNNFNWYLKNNFKIIRIETEKFVRNVIAKTKNQEEITLDDIYKCIQKSYSLNDYELEFLKNLEIQCEINNLIPITKNINKIKDLINSDNNVILISDMYHSKTTIKQILTQIDPIFNNIEIFVSSEYKKNKSSGELYKYIKNLYNPQYWEHCGDNIYADYSKAKHNKINAKLYDYPKLKGYEKEALKIENLTTQYIIGTAKNLRLNSNNSKYNFGASFAGPILYQYVNWILENALKENIENLYFIARDGYIPKLIADIIIQHKNINIKTHYIYGSRKAWRIPEENNIDKFVSYILNEYLDKLNGNIISNRMGLTKEEFEKFAGIKCDNKIIKGEKRKNLLKQLLANNEFKTFLFHKFNTKRDITLKYLQQEIDFSKNNFAFVDINGSGRTQDMLTNIISKIYKGNIRTFYFCSELNLSEYPNSIKKIFICSDKYRHAWLELLCRTPYGQTTGYQNNNGIIQPVLENINPQNLINWGYNEYLKGIIDFTTNFVELDKNIKELNQLDFYYKYFNYIIQDSDKETADILGSIPYTNVGSETSIKECSPKYNIFTLILSFFYNSAKTNNLIFISKNRSGKIVKFIINSKLKYKSFRKFLIDIHIHKKREEAFICFFGIKIDLHNLGYKE